MEFEQLMGTLYASIDAIKRGDVDEVEIIRNWDDEDASEGFHVILRREVLGHEGVRLEAPEKEG